MTIDRREGEKLSEAEPSQIECTCHPMSQYHFRDCPLRSDPEPSQIDSEHSYPCRRCGALRTKAEGGTTFTVCDECWDATRSAADAGVETAERYAFKFPVRSYELTRARELVEQRDAAIRADERRKYDAYCSEANALWKADVRRAKEADCESFRLRAEKAEAERDEVDAARLRRLLADRELPGAVVVNDKRYANLQAAESRIAAALKLADEWEVYETRQLCAQELRAALESKE